MRARFVIAIMLGWLAVALAGPPADAQISLLGLKNSLVQFALKQISVPGEMEITAEGVTEPEDGSTSIVGLAVADGEGVWLRIGSLSMRWNARRILRGELDIQSIIAADVEVLRRPNAAPEVKDDADIAQTDDDPFDWPRSPINLVIEELRLDRVKLAEGVIGGQSLAFDATGAAKDEGDEQSVKLSLTRTDAVEGRIDLAYVRTFDANTLKLSLQAEEAAGGLVAELANFPDDSASRVHVDADGPLTDWKLTVDAAADEVFDLDGDAVVQATGRLLVDGDFSLVPGPAVGPEIAAVLGDRAELVFRIAEDEGGVVRVEEGRVTSPHLALTAAGTYAKPTGEADLAVTLKGEQGLAVLAEGVEFTGFGFEGRVAGAVPENVTAEGQLYLDGLKTEPADVGAARLATTIQVRGQRIGFDVTGQMTGFRLDRLTPDLLGETDLRAAGAFDEGVITLDGLALGSPLLTLDARGRADTNASTAALDYALAAPDLAPVARAYDVAADGGIDVSGRVEGPFDAISVTGFARLLDLVFEGEGYGDVTLDHDVTIGETIEGRASVTATGSRYGPAEVATDFRLAEGDLALREMTAQALGATVSGEATITLETSLIRGDIALLAPDLGTLAPLTEQLADQRLGGRVEGQVTLTPVEGRQDADLDLVLSGFEGFEARVARLAVEGALTDALGSPAADVRMTIEEARHPQGSVAGGTVEADVSDLTGAPGGQVKFDLKGLAAAGAAEVGTLVGSADLADLIGNPSARVTLQAQGISAVDAVELARLDANADLAGLADDPSGTLDFRAEGLSAAGARVGSISGKGSFAGVLSTPTGEASVEAGRIDASGVSVPRATLTAKLDQAGTLDARLAAPSVASGDMAVTSVDLAARVTGTLGANPVLDIRTGAGSVAAAPVTVSAPRVTVRGPLSALVIAVDAAGEVDAGRGDPKPLQVMLRARANAATPDVTATIGEARVSAGKAVVELAEPLSIRSSGGTTRVQGIALGLPGGRLDGDLTSYSNGLGGTLALVLSDPGTLAAVMKDFGAELPLASGRVDLDADFDTRPGPARAQVTLNGSDLRFDKAIADIGALGLDASLDWDGRQADAQTELSGPFGDPVRLTASVPLRPSSAIVPVVPNGGEVEGSLVWRGQLGDLWALVPVPDHVLDGLLDVDLKLSGPVGAPRIGGDVSLTQGQYQNLDTGTILTDLTLGSTLSPDGGIVLDITSRDGAKGTVNGQISLDAETVDATLTARQAVLVRRDDVKAQISADLTAKGPLAGPHVAGRVVVDRAEVRLVNNNPPTVADLGDVRFKGDPEPEPEEPAGGAITLDIKVDGPRDIYVRGRGLDSEWRIDLDVGGTAAAPRIVGVIERIRGRLDLLGRDFDLETGEVRFTGGTDIDPTLDVSLARETDGFIGRIEVTGTATAPELHFTSDPQVPEEEVLPRTLFNRSRQSLSPTEALQLAAAIATLLDGSGGIVDELRGAAGIDVLRLDDDGDGLSVTVGKNIADGVFVGASQPVDGGSATVEVEVEVFDNFTVDAEIGQDEGSAFGFSWRKDF